MKISTKIIPAFLREYKSVIITLILLSMITDIFLIKFKSDLIALSILGLIIFFFRFYKIESRKIFIICLIPIIIIFLLFIISSASLAIEKAATWLFMMFGIGAIQGLFKKNKK